VSLSGKKKESPNSERKKNSVVKSAVSVIGKRKHRRKTEFDLIGLNYMSDFPQCSVLHWLLEHSVAPSCKRIRAILNYINISYKPIQLTPWLI